MLLRSTTMQRMGIVVSTIHRAIKFHTTEGIGTVFSTYESDKVKGVKKVRKISMEIEKGVFSCITTEEKVIINNKYPEQTVTIEKQLSKHFKRTLRDLLKANTDVFAWIHADMTRIPRTIMAGILRKVKHQTWVANPIMVKKSDGGWRICVDFTNINKACLKDYYPLLEIEWKVESLLGFRLKGFLDAYKGYHHIQMAEGDEDKMAFFAGEGVFCYRKMPFGLKNVRATYQRLVDKVFHDQIGRKLEAHVDDMIIKILKSCTNKKNIQWTQEAEEALQEMKKFVEILSTLTAPVQGVILIIYLTASTESISVALFAKREEEQQGGYEVPLEDNKKEVEEKADTKPTKTSCEWKLFTDGAVSSDGSGTGLMLIDPEGKKYTYALRFGFETTNNEAEY
ncbi:reverse transcriptase domain-containing protein, partial [Tanacetum coccineum]